MHSQKKSSLTCVRVLSITKRKPVTFTTSRRHQQKAHHTVSHSRTRSNSLELSSRTIHNTRKVHSRSIPTLHIFPLTTLMMYSRRLHSKTHSRQSIQGALL